jgi:V/A-type H+-transporting ATPase subunit D
MPDRLDVSPTQGNLLDLKDDLQRIRSGHDLLDRKREVLTRELMDMISDAESLEQEARELFKRAQDAIQEARMNMGVDRIRWITLANSAEVGVQVSMRSVMGVRVPLVDIQVKTLPLPYSPGDTSVSLDEARQRWLEVMQLLGQWSETVDTVWRMAMELRKTQRRVNALEEVIIPRYEASVDFISQALEEDEREDIVRAKKVKAHRNEGQEDSG